MTILGTPTPFRRTINGSTTIHAEPGRHSGIRLTMTYIPDGDTIAATLNRKNTLDLARKLIELAQHDREREHRRTTP